jgi:hypothetical protein
MGQMLSDLGGAASVKRWYASVTPWVSTRPSTPAVR